MALRKNPRFDLKLKYQRMCEISLILSLLLAIAAFKFFPRIEKQKVILNQAQEIINVQDIEITRQEKIALPPPKPPDISESQNANIPDNIQLDNIISDQHTNVKTLMHQRSAETRKTGGNTIFFVAVEDMPEPVGGIQAIQNKIIYPETARRNNIEGRVFIRAFIDETGAVTKTEIIRGIGGGCDEAAEAAVKATKFKPGRHVNTFVKVQVSIPVLFKLQ